MAIPWAVLLPFAVSAADIALRTAKDQLEGAKHPLSCVFVNNTPWTWKKVEGLSLPRNGQPVKHPDATVVSIQDGAEKIGENEWAETNNTAWSVKSKGKDSDIVVVYMCEFGDSNPFLDYNYYVAFWANNRGLNQLPRAGVSLSRGMWFNEFKHKNDSESKWIRKHIIHPYYLHHHDHGKWANYEWCAYSKKGEARYITTPDDKIKISFQAAEEVTFKMDFNWDEFYPDPELEPLDDNDSQ